MTGKLEELVEGNVTAEVGIAKTENSAAKKAVVRDGIESQK